MGPALDRVLARPSALRALRQLMTDSNELAHLHCRLRCGMHTDKPFDTSSKRRKEDSANRELREHGRNQRFRHARRGPTRRNYTTAATAQSSDTPHQSIESERSWREPRFGSFQNEAPGLQETAELGLQMSLNAGVPLLHDGDGECNVFETLRYEADVLGPATKGKRMVDQVENSTNMDLWIELLSFRHRLDGLKGVLDIWKGMRRRKIDLPTCGEAATTLWHAILGLDLKTEAEKKAHTDEVLDYAMDLKSRTGQQYESLHKLVVGHWLREERPSFASVWHKVLIRDGLAPTDALRNISYDALYSRDPKAAFKCFRIMYKRSQERNLYDPVITELLKIDDKRRTLAWHQMFIKHDDCPSTLVASKPAVMQLFELADPEAPLSLVNHDDCGTRTSIKEQPQYPALTRESMSKLVGEVHGIKPKEVNDGLCARIFATKAFSIELITAGLAFFGVQTLGPLALREMATRAGSATEVSAKIKELKAAGIDISSSTFSRAVRRFADAGQDELLQSMLSSDQHSDAYEDGETQEALLDSFIAAKDYHKAHTTLAILALTSPQAHPKVWNILFQAFCCHSTHERVMQIYQEMSAQCIALDEKSTNFAYAHLLCPRQRGNAPAWQKGNPGIDDLGLVARILLEAVKADTFVGPWKWQEILKRYGMLNRLDELESLCFWLTDRYSTKLVESSNPMKSGQISSRRGLGNSRLVMLNQLSRFSPLQPLRQIFDRKMQRALISWGFTNEAKSGNAYATHGKRESLPKLEPDMQSEYPERCESWARGIALLQSLQRCGVLVDTNAIRREVRLRLWALYSPVGSVNTANARSRLNNRLSLLHRVRHIQQVWQGGLLLLPRELLEENRKDVGARLAVALFGPRGPRGRVRARIQDSGLQNNDSVPPNPLDDRMILRYLRAKPGRVRFFANTLAHGVKTSRHCRHELRALQQRRPPSARSTNSHPQPSQTNIPEHA